MILIFYSAGCLNETYSFSGALSPVHHSSSLKVVTAKTNLAVIFNEANPSGPAVDHTTMTEDGEYTCDYSDSRLLSQKYTIGNILL